MPKTPGRGDPLQPGQWQHRTLTEPTGHSPGYKPRFVKTLPTHGQQGDMVYDQSSNQVCVWDDGAWYCWGSNNAPCYDYVVDPDGNGTHTTIEDLFVTLNALNNADVSVFICPGQYEVQDISVNIANDVSVAIHAGGFANGDAGICSTRIISASVAAGQNIFVIEAGGTGNGLSWHNIQIGHEGNSGRAQYAFAEGLGGSNASLSFFNCIINGKWGTDLAGAWFSNCKFEHGFIHDVGGSIDTVEFYDCDFSSGDGTYCLRITGSGLGMGQTLLQGCRFNRKIHFDTNASLGGVRIANCIFGTSGTGGNWIHFAGASTGRIQIVNNDFSVPTDTNGAIYIENVSGDFELVIVGNQFDRTTGSVNPYIRSSDTSARAIITGNVFQADTVGNYVEDSGGVSVIGNFSRSVFGPNYPAQKVKYNITGSNNEFYPGSSSSGTPGPGGAISYADLRYNMFNVVGSSVDSWIEGAALTAAATLTPGTDGDFFHVTGNTGITAIATPTRQVRLLLAWDGTPTLTHSANLILQGAVNYTAAAGDVSEFVWEGGTVWREINRHTAAAAGGGGHAIRDETSAALTQRSDLHFMGLGVLAQDNASRTEVIIPGIYDLIVDSNDTNAAGKSNVYNKIADAITAGTAAGVAHTIWLRNCNDTADITIGSGDKVTAILGQASTVSSVPVNIICQKQGTLFQNLLFNGKYLSFEAESCRAFACVFIGLLTSPTANINDAGGISATDTSCGFNGGANGGLTSGYYRCEEEYFNSSAGGHASSGTLTIPAASRGARYTLQTAHADGKQIVDIGIGHLMIKAANCEVTACFWSGCSNRDAQGVYITSAATGSRITACGFTNNTCYNNIAIAAASGEPKSLSFVGNKFVSLDTGSGLLQSYHIDFWPNVVNSNTHSVIGFQLNGNVFRGLDNGGVRYYTARVNASGNSFDGATSGAVGSTIQNLCDVDGGSAVASTDTSIPVDTPTGSNGTRPTYQGIILTPSGEYVAYSRFATATTTGTSTAVAATTMTDGGAAWTTDQWKGQVVTHDNGGTKRWGIIQSNTATVLTIDSWRGGLPGGTGTYAVEQTLIGCVRGFNGSTAASINDNDALIYIEQVATWSLPGNAIIAAQGNLQSGSTFSGLRVINWQQETFKGTATTYSTGNTEPVLFTGNSITSCTTFYAGVNYAYTNNSVAGAHSVDARTNDIVFIGMRGGVTATSWGAGSTIISPSTITGIHSRYRLPTGLVFQFGAAAGGTGGPAHVFTNRTGSASVAQHVVLVDTANDNSFIETTTGGDEQVLGVVSEGGVANTSPCVVQTSGVCTLLCDGTVTRGDYIETSTTAGIGRSAGAAKTLVSFAIALTGRSGGGSSAVTVRLL